MMHANGRSGDNDAKSQYIYSDNKVLDPAVCFAKLV